MTAENEKLLDEIGLKIVRTLQQDARISFAELGRQVGLTAPAIAERVRKLEEAGIITGFRAEINPAKVGLTLMAFIRMTVPTENYSRLLAFMRELPEVLECHHVTGDDSFIVKVLVTSIPHLERLVGQISPFGQTLTTIVLSSPIVKPVIELPPDVETA